jgi:hypothetical protein
LERRTWNLSFGPITDELSPWGNYGRYDRAVFFHQPLNTMALLILEAVASIWNSSQGKTAMHLVGSIIASLVL